MGLLLKIGIPAIAVIALAVVGIFFLFLNNSPDFMLARALSNLGEEMQERIDGTPLKALMMIVDTVNDGTIGIELEYEDRWGDSTSGNVEFSSIIEDRDFALVGDISYEGQDIDFSVYMNKERIAVGSNTIDNNYYGFSYDTFRSDVRSFGNAIGLDSQAMDQFADMVDFINESMNAEAVEFSDTVIVDIFKDFNENLETTSEKVQIVSGGGNVSCTKINYYVTKEALIGLIDGYIDLMENDDSVRTQFDLYSNPLFAEVFPGDYYNSTMSELKRMANEFERSFSGEVICSFFIGSGDRCLRIEIDADVMYDGEGGTVFVLLDFGASAIDSWKFEVSFEDEYESGSVLIDWSYQERGGNIENTVDITIDNDYSSDTVTLSSKWSPVGGAYTLSFSTYWDTYDISGVFTVSGDDFRLSLDNPFSDFTDESFSLVITGKSGAVIRQIDYINIDRWSDTLIPAVENFVTSMFY